jgi:hypothetical protein
MTKKYLRSIIYRWVEFELKQLSPKSPFLPNPTKKHDSRLSRTGSYVFFVVTEGACRAHRTDRKLSPWATKMLEFGVAFRSLDDHHQMSLLIDAYGLSDATKIAGDIKVWHEICSPTFSERRKLWKRLLNAAWLELKSRGSRLSPDQQKVILMLQYLGHEVYEVRSFKQFLDIVNGDRTCLTSIHSLRPALKSTR